MKEFKPVDAVAYMAQQMLVAQWMETQRLEIVKKAVLEGKCVYEIGPDEIVICEVEDPVLAAAAHRVHKPKGQIL